MVVSIIGGGNIGTLMAGEFAAAGHEVRLCASDANKWFDSIHVYDQDDALVCEGKLALVSGDIAEVLRGAEVVFITYPTFLLKSIAERMLPYVEVSQLIGVVPGNDAEFFFAEHVKRGATMFGLQRVHCVARMRERGRSVYRLGEHRGQLHVAALPTAKTPEVAHTIEALFGIPTESLPNYLVETLTPSNPILHTTRIRTMFRDWVPGKTYDHNILFYEEWDIPSAELMIAADAELQQVCRALEKELDCDLSQVRSLKLHYESPDALAMVVKITSIPAFKGLASPMKEVAPGEWVPDFNSRYFHADFAYGLKAIKDIATLAGVDAPTINEVYGWYLEVVKPIDIFSGVPATLEALAALYR